MKRPNVTCADIILGTMNFGSRTGRHEALRIIDHTHANGIMTIDTSNVYSSGESERIIGEAIHRRRDVFHVATKVGLGRRQGRPEGLSADAIISACEASLRRLRTDYIDTYFLHVPDYTAKPEETINAIKDLLASGKIRRWGTSNHSSWQILELFHLSESAGIQPPSVSQQVYNAIVRQLEIEYFRFAEYFRIHTQIYNPLAGGLLASPPRSMRQIPNLRPLNSSTYRNRYFTPAAIRAARKYARLARLQGSELVEIAYRVLRWTPGVDSVIVGPASVEHLDPVLKSTPPPEPDLVQRWDAIYQDLVGTDMSYAR